MTEAPPSGWEDILRPGETIVWQGRPGQGLRFTSNLMSVLMGLFITGFALFWTSMAFKMTHDDGFPAMVMPLFGLIFIYNGIRLAGGEALWDAYRRSQTWYTLTDQRAFIARSTLGRKSLDSWEVDRFDTVEYDYGPPANVWFATARGRKGGTTKIGFRDIDDAHKVRDLIRDMQKDTPA